MKKYEIIIYSKEDGTEPVLDFLKSLPSKLQAKAIRELELLSEYGSTLTEPYSKHLENGIFELRVQQSNNIVRILYFFMVNHQIVVTNGFIKKTQKTPKREIQLAMKYRLNYLLRMEVVE